MPDGPDEEGAAGRLGRPGQREGEVVQLRAEVDNHIKGQGAVPERDVDFSGRILERRHRAQQLATAVGHLQQEADRAPQGRDVLIGDGQVADECEGAVIVQRQVGGGDVGDCG